MAKTLASATSGTISAMGSRTASRTWAREGKHCGRSCPFALPEGQFAAQSLLHLPALASVDVSITGGSGDYRTAQGFIRTVPAGETERHFTVHMQR
ncbi:hypothetical protein [Streptomyces sp. NPDC051219]|uniref:hypothetical protein n=1 Tax=Streptomyces sp. NPDC051219 TaxID=3155283 RepID=UPI00342D7796